MGTAMKYGHLSEKEKLRWELESLRQENARLREAVTNAERNTHEDSKLITKMHGENNRLRERMNQLTDDYEGTIKRLREALEQLSNACKPLEYVEWCNLTKADEQTLNEVEHQRLLARAVLNPPKPS